MTLTGPVSDFFSGHLGDRPTHTFHSELWTFIPVWLRSLRKRNIQMIGPPLDIIGRLASQCRSKFITLQNVRSDIGHTQKNSFISHKMNAVHRRRLMHRCRMRFLDYVIFIRWTTVNNKVMPNISLGGFAVFSVAPPSRISYINFFLGFGGKGLTFCEVRFFFKVEGPWPYLEPRPNNLKWVAKTKGQQELAIITVPPGWFELSVSDDSQKSTPHVVDESIMLIGCVPK